MHPIDAHVLKKLEALLVRDIDEIRGIDRALERIQAQDEDVRAQLSRLREEHERHVEDLAGLVRRYGGVVPARAPSGRSSLLTRLFSGRTTASALRALRAREQMMRQAYADVLADARLPAEMANVVRRCRDDERSHVDALRDVLRAHA